LFTVAGQIKGVSMRRRPSALLIVAVFAAVLATGCSKTEQQSTSTTSTTASPMAAASTAAQSAAMAPAGDVAHGKSIFTDKCVMCHGVNGVGGGVGPSLKNEKTRKNLAQAIAWIKNPRSPMPKYYPKDLDAKGVADVAAFVETL